MAPPKLEASVAQPRPVASLVDGRPADLPRAALVQSRETGPVLPRDTPLEGQVQALPFAKSWVHFMAGGHVHRLPPPPERASQG